MKLLLEIHSKIFLDFVYQSKLFYVCILYSFNSFHSDPSPNLLQAIPFLFSSSIYFFVAEHSRIALNWGEKQKLCPPIVLQVNN